MHPISPWRLIGVAAVLEVIGVILPMLMVIGKLPSTWLLNTLAFLSSVIGLFIGWLYWHFHVCAHTSAAIKNAALRIANRAFDLGGGSRSRPKTPTNQTLTLSPASRRAFAWPAWRREAGKLCIAYPS